MYLEHLGRMTAEDLNSKSDIAAELAHRDIQIEYLRSLLERSYKEFMEVLVNLDACMDFNDGDDFLELLYDIKEKL